jgi:hypothetical protein
MQVPIGLSNGVDIQQPVRPPLLTDLRIACEQPVALDPAINGDVGHVNPLGASSRAMLRPTARNPALAAAKAAYPARPRTDADTPANTIVPTPCGTMRTNRIGLETRVTDKSLDLMTGGPHLGNQGVNLGGGATGNEDLKLFACETPRGGRSDSAAGADPDDQCVLDVCHQTAPRIPRSRIAAPSPMPQRQIAVIRQPRMIPCPWHSMPVGMKVPQPALIAFIKVIASIALVKNRAERLRPTRHL